MKLKKGFILREVAGETVVIPSGNDLDLNMMITLNDTGKFIWEKLEEGILIDDLVDAVCGEYEVTRDRAREAVCAFIAKLNDNGFLEN